MKFAAAASLGGFFIEESEAGLQMASQAICIETFKKICRGPFIIGAEGLGVGVSAGRGLETSILPVRLFIVRLHSRTSLAGALLPI